MGYVCTVLAGSAHVQPSDWTAHAQFAPETVQAGHLQPSLPWSQGRAQQGSCLWSSPGSSPGVTQPPRCHGAALGHGWGVEDPWNKGHLWWLRPGWLAWRFAPAQQDWIHSPCWSDWSAVLGSMGQGERENIRRIFPFKKGEVLHAKPKQDDQWTGLLGTWGNASFSYFPLLKLHVKLTFLLCICRESLLLDCMALSFN